MKDSWSPRTEGRRQGRAVRLVVAGYLPSPSITVLAVWPVGSYLMTVQVDISEQCSFVGLHATPATPANSCKLLTVGCSPK